MKLELYEHLLAVNAGFDQAIRAIGALRKYHEFRPDEIARFSALSRETRAAVNSYLLGVLEGAETAEAGRRFEKRWEQQHRDERKRKT